MSNALGSAENPLIHSGKPQLVKNSQCIPGQQVTHLNTACGKVACFLREQLGIEHCGRIVAKPNGIDPQATACAELVPAVLDAASATPNHNYLLCLRRAAGRARTDIEQLLIDIGIPELQKKLCNGCAQWAGEQVEQDKVFLAPQPDGGIREVNRPQPTR